MFVKWIWSHVFFFFLSNSFDSELSHFHFTLDWKKGSVMKLHLCLSNDSKAMFLRRVFLCNTYSNSEQSDKQNCTDNIVCYLKNGRIRKFHNPSVGCNINKKTNNRNLRLMADCQHIWSLKHWNVFILTNQNLPYFVVFETLWLSFCRF